jgi:GeoRSP system SPASM domain protein
MLVSMELKSPIRLYWDVSPLPAKSFDYIELCREVVALKFLSLDLTLSHEDLDDVGWAILEYFSRSPLAISLTITGIVNPRFIVDNLLSTHVKAVCVQVSSLADLKRLEPLFLCGDSAGLGVSYLVTSDSWEDIPDVIKWCANHPVSRLVLPMQRLVNGEDPFFLSLAERERLANGIVAHDCIAGKLQVIVHDPFLWRAIFPSIPFPEGKCQGGNTMLYIASDGIIYPCPTFPYSLGSLRDSSLSQIVRSEKKQAARNSIRRIPSECRCCEDASQCGGGCRGRGYAVAGSWEQLDPGCR